MDLEPTASLLSTLRQCSSILIKFLLVSSPDITEPLSVWIYTPSLRISWSCFHFFDVGLLPVHVQPVDCGASSELRAWFAT